MSAILESTLIDKTIESPRLRAELEMMPVGNSERRAPGPPSATNDPYPSDPENPIEMLFKPNWFEVIEDREHNHSRGAWTMLYRR